MKEQNIKPGSTIFQVIKILIAMITAEENRCNRCHADLSKTDHLKECVYSETSGKKVSQLEKTPIGWSSDAKLRTMIF